MKPIHFAAICLLNSSFLFAQEPCKVKIDRLVGSYKGGCQNGLASGEGEAKGTDRYSGKFKEGLPDGNGTYYYNDSVYYTGKFQLGIKEGKGEMHYIQKKGVPDSVLTGYWSADVYRGKKYITYNFSTTDQFDQTDFSPSAGSGNTVTIEIGTITGSPAGPNTGYVLSLRDLISPTSSIVKRLTQYESAFKSYVSYELTGFPCKLFGTLSDGRTFELELYKAANWKVRLFQNK